MKIRYLGPLFALLVLLSACTNSATDTPVPTPVPAPPTAVATLSPQQVAEETLVVNGVENLTQGFTNGAGELWPGVYDANSMVPEGWNVEMSEDNSKMVLTYEVTDFKLVFTVKNDMAANKQSLETSSGINDEASGDFSAWEITFTDPSGKNWALTINYNPGTDTRQQFSVYISAE